MAEREQRRLRGRGERSQGRIGLLVRQSSTYLGVGVATALLELGLFELLLFGGAPLALANVVAVCTATGVNFLLNGTVTFKGSSNYARSLFLYLVLFGLNTTFSTLAIGWLTELGIASYVAKGATMVCIVCWNFVLYKKVVFR